MVVSFIEIMSRHLKRSLIFKCRVCNYWCINLAAGNYNIAVSLYMNTLRILFQFFYINFFIMKYAGRECRICFPFFEYIYKVLHGSATTGSDDRYRQLLRE